MTIRVKIGRKTTEDERNGMIMITTKRKSLGSGKISLVFGDDTLEFRLHHKCHNCLNRMELGNNVEMTHFLGSFPFDGN
jgi:hypothetical protein